MSEWQQAGAGVAAAVPLFTVRPEEQAISNESNLPANPYAPPENQSHLGDAAAPDRAAEKSPSRTYPQSLMIWTLVCVVSAAPSFLWGLSTIAGSQALAMLTGVAIFIALYTLGDQWTQHWQWRRDKSVRLALKIGYVTRLAISVIFPVGGFLDMFCGLFSVSAVEFVTGNNVVWDVGPGESEVFGVGFFFTLITTLVQGCVLNVVLFGYVLVIWGIVVLVQPGR